MSNRSLSYRAMVSTLHVAFEANRNSMTMSDVIQSEYEFKLFAIIDI